MELSPDPNAPAAVRAAVAAHAATCGVPSHRVADVVLCASELVANAVEHGCDEPVEVTASALDGGRYVLSVTQRCEGSAIPPVESWELPGVTAPSGRGLGIVRAVADDVGRVVADHEATVVATFHWGP